MVQKEEMYQENQGGVAGSGASPVERERKDKSYWWAIAIIGIAIAIVATVLIF